MSEEDLVYRVLADYEQALERVPLVATRCGGFFVAHDNANEFLRVGKTGRKKY